MDFFYYIQFFHDGGLNDIEYRGNDLIIYMNSRAILPQHNKDSIRLNDESLMQGQLIVVGVDSILIGGNLLTHPLTREECEGEILDFNVEGDRVLFGMTPFVSKRNSKQEQFFTLEISGQQIIWEDLYNNAEINLTGQYLRG